MCVWSQKISYRKIQERPHLWSNFGGGGKSRQEKSADWNLSSKHPLQDVRSTGSRVSNAVETLSKKTRLRETNSISLTPHSCVFFFFQERGKGSGHMEGISTDGMKPGQEERVPHWTCHRPDMGLLPSAPSTTRQPQGLRIHVPPDRPHSPWMWASLTAPPWVPG